MSDPTRTVGRIHNPRCPHAVAPCSCGAGSRPVYASDYHAKLMAEERDRVLANLPPGSIAVVERHQPALSFADLRAVNVPRCVQDFKHELNSWSAMEWAAAMCGEAGETANVAKKMRRLEQGVAGNKGADLDPLVLRVKLAQEIADVVIYCDLLAASQGIDLGEAVRETFNRKSEELGSQHELSARPLALPTDKQGNSACPDCGHPWRFLPVHGCACVCSAEERDE